jgi:hypothetical protein
VPCCPRPLALQGKRVCVFDRPQAGRSSAVAAGMVNPIVLRRTIPSWRASEMLAIAGAFYRELEMRYDTTFWHPLTLAAIFPTAQEAGIWQLRTKDPEIAPFLERESTADVALESLPRPYGHGVVKRCGWFGCARLSGSTSCAMVQGRRSSGNLGCAFGSHSCSGRCPHPRAQCACRGVLRRSVLCIPRLGSGPR